VKTNWVVSARSTTFALVVGGKIYPIQSALQAIKLDTVSQYDDVILPEKVLKVYKLTFLILVAVI
jgi:hypothetical protein